MNENLTVVGPELPAKQAPSIVEILQGVLKAGVTPENVLVVDRLVGMAREVRAEEAKAAFAKSFFQLRKNAPEIYADKEVKDANGKVCFSYCSPDELNRIVEPLLLSYGFTTMSGQEMPADGKVTVSLTLMHEAGHSETRTFTVRVSPGNSLMNATKCDEAATTSALRHLMIKMIGLKTRCRMDDDPRVEGDADPITPAQAEDLRRRVRETASNEPAFLKFAGAPTYEMITKGNYGRLDENLRRKERTT